LNGWQGTDSKTGAVLWRRQPLLPWPLVAILVLYITMGLAYAALTPLWEAPDEPAHYNYVRYLIEHRRLPVLQAADYDFAYLERIKAARFPPDMSISPIRYEFHQPPLYYLIGALLAAPLPENWQPMALRLFSVMLGAVFLYVAFWVVTEIFPARPVWALGATAFAAFVPMHVAMTASVNNDTLAELFLALVLLMLVRRLGGQYTVNWRGDLRLGLLIGLALVTKTTAYVAVPLAVIALFGEAVLLGKAPPDGGQSTAGLPWRNALVSLIRVLSLALLIGLPWFVRNSLTYGGLDILGLIRHNSIMLEQPHTADWLARLGWPGLIMEFLVTTFRSFWAQFGWMGILVDERIYMALALFCVLAGLGCIMFFFRTFKALTVPQRWCLGLLAISFLFTFLAYLWYNVQFVQHQGRYLFPALVAISVFFALGIWTLLDRGYAGYLTLSLVAATAAVGLIQLLVTGAVNKWLLALLGGTAVAFGVRSALPSRWQIGLYALVFFGLWVLDAVCLFAFIVPYFYL